MMSAYYNENDPYAAQWLRNLISAGAIAAGDVDERSIKEVQANDLKGYDRCHFFAGIGGWDLALNLAGWGDAPVWTGSCPCQPFSGAGLRKGAADERHLWPALYRLVAECEPATVFGEQVGSPLGREWLAAVRLDLEDLGYACGGADLCAAGVGAPHIRQRLFWVADSGGKGRQQERRSALADEGAYGRRPEENNKFAGDGENGGRLAHAEHSQRRAVDLHREDGRDGPDDRREEAHGVIGTRGEVCGGMGDADREHGRPSPGQEEEDRPESGNDGRLGDAAGERRGQEYTDAGRGGEGGSAQGGEQRPWDDCCFIPCSDGKWRPTQSGIHPLAYGVPPDLGCSRSGETSAYRAIIDPKTGRSIGQAPWRIGMLRGHGNAIVPPVAAEFVTAFLECAP